MDCCRSDRQGALYSVGPYAVLGGCLSGRRVAGKRHGWHGPGARRDDGEVSDSQSSTLDLDFCGKKPDSCGSPGSLLSWYQEILPKKSESSALLQLFHHFSYNENPTTTLNTPLKYSLPSTDALTGREKIHACIWSSRPPLASALHWNLPGSHKKKIRLDTFLTVVFSVLF